MPYVNDGVRLDHMSTAQICWHLEQVRTELAESARKLRRQIDRWRREADAELEDKQAVLKIRRRNGCRAAINELCLEIKAIQDRTDERIKLAHRELRNIAARQHYIDSELLIYQPWT